MRSFSNQQIHFTMFKLDEKCDRMIEDMKKNYNRYNGMTMGLSDLTGALETKTIDDVIDTFEDETVEDIMDALKERADENPEFAEKL